MGITLLCSGTHDQGNGSDVQCTPTVISRLTALMRGCHTCLLMVEVRVMGLELGELRVVKH